MSIRIHPSSTETYELIVQTKPNVIAKLVSSFRKYPASTFYSRELSKAASKLTQTLLEVGATVQIQLGVTVQKLFRNKTDFDELQYYRILAEHSRLEEMAEQFLKHPEVSAAYIKPPARLPVYLLSTKEVSLKDPPKNTPDFTTHQSYLEAAPVGIDAKFAWTKPGGDGSGVRVIDIEGGWRFAHEDLLENKGGVVAGTPSPLPGWDNHGTAVLGVLGGDKNAFGVTGICPKAYLQAASVIGLGSSTAIQMSADLLGPGDIILIELHRLGPRARKSDSRVGYLPIEWWPDDFDAIQYATRKGIIVVEAAGNGFENLDDPLYDKPARGFPKTWKNPFRRKEADSGAILAGAGACPPGTHKRNHGPDRSRLDFSNYGSMVDAQGWGIEVTTCGYGDLQAGKDRNRWYTDQFGGTSSASPVVVGAIACLQGMLRAKSQTLLTPSSARKLLRSTGTPQSDAPKRPKTQRIGNRPNLKEMTKKLFSQQTEENTSFSINFRTKAESNE